jgi:hypothetical protein
LKESRRFLAFIIALAAALISAGVFWSCSAVPADARIGIDAPNGSEQEFGLLVGDYLEHRCGSLDCHGQMSRNLRIWGCEGMRLDPHALPICGPLGGGVTTAAEHQATYRSLVGLEPTVMSAVVEGHGAHPELLTFVRKARGLEAHKGGTLITPGDDQDVCITSWLAGNTNADACNAAIGYPMFPQDASFE